MYYLFYAQIDSGHNPGIGVSKSIYPYGPFEDMGTVTDCESSKTHGDIDEFYIETQNHTKYLFWGSGSGIYGQELAKDMKTVIGEHFQICGGGMEGSLILEKDGKFWYFGSSGGCCDGNRTKYYVHVGVADNIRGPYHTQHGKSMMDGVGTVLLHGDSSIGWIGPGHIGEIRQDDKGRWFVLYHAVAFTDPLFPLPWGFTRRPLMMDEILWDGPNGWPRIENDVPSVTWKRAPHFSNTNDK
jgi:arabinan endo-1,5-alpha-L-arabinosidase